MWTVLLWLSCCILVPVFLVAAVAQNGVGPVLACLCCANRGPKPKPKRVKQKRVKSKLYKI
jgi:hypothetical protein